MSRYLQRETLTTFGCTACRIEVIPNFIDPDVYDRSQYTSMLDEQVDANKRVLMHMSNFRPVKRVKDVVRIFARVAERVPSVLVMVGDGPDRVDAEAEARDARRAGQRVLPREDRHGRAAARRRRSLSAAVEQRVVRP